jgi:preprotein translocase subunit SecE
VFSLPKGAAKRAPEKQQKKDKLAGQAMVQIYKKGQGKYTRTVTFVSSVVVALIAAVAMSKFLAGFGTTRPPLIRFGIPTLLVIGVGLLVLWVINRAKTADFLIATEGEMKKVSWSSKKEIVGSTKVVIVTTFILAAVLFGVDIAFIFLFDYTGVSG